jgi:hypothetical protein
VVHHLLKKFCVSSIKEGRELLSRGSLSSPSLTRCLMITRASIRGAGYLLKWGSGEKDMTDMDSVILNMRCHATNFVSEVVEVIMKVIYLTDYFAY